MRQIIMPQLGESMQEATLLNWCIQEGESFQQGDVIFEIETEKVAFDVEAPFSGTLTKILVTDGETVAVATPLAETEEIRS
jgi:pyruvate/2-oxoglutarate dehydrogenase complex dihydrolipoamide acyltransferase (E2) component